MPMRQEVAALPEGWSAYQDDEGVDLFQVSRRSAVHRGQTYYANPA